MTDRELLELVALAAGVNVWTDIDGNYYSEGFGIAEIPWNPLTDDGDALRLAVKMYLWEAVRLAHREVSDTVDIYAATRRAIVRAAAEIGKSMSGQSNHPAKVA